MRTLPLPVALAVPLAVAALASGCGIGRVLVSFDVDAAESEERLERRLAEQWFEALDRRPELAADSGVHKDATRWDPLPASPEAVAAAARVQTAIEELEDDFSPRDLEPRSARFFTRARAELARQRDALTNDVVPAPHPWRGSAIGAPGWLARSHPTRDIKDFEAWIDRLSSLSVLVRSEARRARAGEGAARHPRALLSRTIDELTKLRSPDPASIDPFLGPFHAALEGTPAATRERLERQARAVVRHELRPAYAELVNVLEDDRARATETSGAYRRRDLFDAWTATLRAAAGPDLEPLVLHELGLAQVQRLHGELRSLAPPDISLSRWFDDLRVAEDSPARPPTELWRDVLVGLPRLLGDITVAAPEIVEAWSFESAATRWSPLVPGSAAAGRPDRWLRFSTQPGWWAEFEALHHGLPGRALYRRQVARAPVPDLLAHAQQRAHEEGWSLWIALAALEEGIVPERDGGFGRLAAELVHAASLVADTGLHGRRWTLGQTVDYLRDATPLSAADCELLAHGIAAEPGRAAAPYLGLVRIRTLERQAQLALGDDLDRAAFRLALLDEGPLGPEDLEERVARWIRAQS